jgi:hypothetical protein
VKPREIAQVVDRIDDIIDQIPATIADPHNEQLEALRQLKVIRVLLWSISFALKQPEVSQERGSLVQGRRMLK